MARGRPVRIIPAADRAVAGVFGHRGGQTFAVQARAAERSPTRPQPGGGLAFSPTSRLTFMVDIERTHLSSQSTRTPRVTSAFRGGTVTLAAPALRVSLLGGDRVGPYGIVGLAAGVSRPNVTDLFPGRVTNEVRAPFAGGGIQVPLRNRVTFFAEARMMLVVGKGADELFAVAPFRAGVAWRFLELQHQRRRTCASNSTRDQRPGSSPSTHPQIEP